MQYFSFVRHVYSGVSKYIYYKENCKIVLAVKVYLQTWNLYCCEDFEDSVDAENSQKFFGMIASCPNRRHTICSIYLIRFM